MIRNHTLGILILILVVVAALVGATNIYMLYESSFEAHRDRLSQLAKTQAHLINSVAREDEKYGDRRHPEGATSDTLRKVIAALKQYEGFGETGEFVLARMLEGKVHVLHTQRAKEDVELIHHKSPKAHALKKALRGETGTHRGLDYQAQEVLAAHHHIPLLSLGLVVKMNVHEIKKPFIKSAMTSGLVALITTILGAFLFYYFGNPLMQKMKRYNEQLEEDVVERTESLKVANEALADEVQIRKKAERAKDDFVSTVSHELRTPLTAIIGSMGLLRGGVGGTLAEKAQRMIEIAHTNGERLLRLINNILDIEKMQSGKMQLDLEKLDLLAVVKQSLEVNEEFARKYDVTFGLDSQAQGALPISADSDKIIQVLTNLLSNAVKYSPQGAAVTVGVELEGESKARVSVRDLGAGIPEEFKPKIFGKFSQADTSTTKQVGGTGLGLSIAKAIVEKHSGTIGFDSTEGQGTCFYFIIPLAK